MGLLSPYLNVAGAAQVKVKTLRKPPAERVRKREKWEHCGVNLTSQMIKTMGRRTAVKLDEITQKSFFFLHDKELLCFSLGSSARR